MHLRSSHRLYKSSDGSLRYTSSAQDVIAWTKRKRRHYPKCHIAGYWVTQSSDMRPGIILFKTHHHIFSLTWEGIRGIVTFEIGGTMFKALRTRPFRPPDKSAYWKIIFFISHPKHMLWVL